MQNYIVWWMWHKYFIIQSVLKENVAIKLILSQLKDSIGAHSALAFVYLD